MVEVDRNTIIQIFGSLMNNPNLLSDIDKYQIIPTDFSRELDKYVFSAIYNLYIGGAQNIHATDIEMYLKSNEYAYKILTESNGISFLADCENYSDPGNFYYYYNRLKKIALLRELARSGKDISKFYSDDPLDDNHIKINEKFEKLTPTDIVNALKGEIAVLEERYSTNKVVQESNAFSGVKELLEELKIKPEVGTPLQGDIFNSVSRGGRKGKMYLRSGSSGLGKALPNYTLIPTTEGWKTVGEIKVGDYLFDRFGKPTKVLKIYPQPEKKQIYKVYFKSGKVAECCNEHLWSYYSNKNDKNPNRLITKTLQEIIDNPKGLRDKDGAYRWSVPVCEPVRFPTKNLPVDPYVMGLILGDGSFRYDNNQKAFYYSSQDEELVVAIKERMHYKCYRKNSEYNYNWTFELKDQSKGHKNVWVEDILKDFPLLWQAKSEDKFIPEEYLYGDVEQRFDLLAGLLDTDGTIDEKGRVNYTTISPQLRNNIMTLCESLGMSCTYLTDKRVDKYTTGKCYTVHIQARKEIKNKMFKLSRKVQRANNYINNCKRCERRDRDSIIKIEATDNYADMTCFYVDNIEHLFLMNNYICTHNTRSMVGDACNMAYPIRFEPSYNKWVATGHCEKVLYIMTEQDPAEIQTMILAYLTGINEEVFLYGLFEDDQMDRIMKAVDIMEKYKDNMLFAHVPDPCASVIKNLFRRYNLQHEVENFFFDYIFSSPAMLEEYRDLKLPEYVCLRLFTTCLKNLAVELNAFVMTSTQITDDGSDGFKDYHVIQGSKSIVNLVDLACIMSRPSPAELEITKDFQRQYSLVPNCITDIFKNRRGRWTMIRIWSRVDLGTCKKYDLFATTPDNKPIEDFQIVSFGEEVNRDLKELEDFYNLGVVSEKQAEQLFSGLEEDYDMPPTLMTEMETAFGDKVERRKKLEDVGFEDLV